MEALLELLQKNARISIRELADRLNLDEGTIREKLKEFEENGTIIGYHAVINDEKANATKVTAFIEIKLTPEREGGFDHLATRIAKFAQVKHCYLMSGGYDLIAVVQGDNLREVAQFISEKLSSIDGVIATSTHFQLKVYKQSGFLASDGFEDHRPKVS